MASTAKTLAAPNMRVLRPSQLRKMKGTEQAAAVCFRVQNRRIEFLLVQTGGGRWTFPKGSAEPGLTRAQAAALEAFEEAGSWPHGRDVLCPLHIASRRHQTVELAEVEFLAESGCSRSSM